LKPLIAIPATAGTGSETTGVSIFDLSKMRAKTGIASRRLKPTLGLLDPENTRTMPAQVAAATGLDVLSHAVESYTALPYSGSSPAGSPFAAARVSGDRIPSATCGRSGHAHGRALPGACGGRSFRRQSPRQHDPRLPRTPASDSATPACTAARMSYPVSGMVKGYYESDIPVITRWCRMDIPSS
jgi:hydroxyacid-oxoacid transhydrogenase